MSHSRPAIAIVLKGYPRLSETFIAQEIKALQDRGFSLTLISLRHPTDKSVHPIHREITAQINYLPEYLHQEPWRVLKALLHGIKSGGFKAALSTWMKDLRRDFSPNRMRRFGQALVLARELPEQTCCLYAHFMHTPGSVARYCAILTGKPWAFSAHAKDIWTLDTWEKQEKLAACRFAVTCTQANFLHLRGLSPRPDTVHRVYHGLDFSRFPDPGPAESHNRGTNPDDSVRLLSVGRAVPKKGYDILLRALALLPSTLHWRLHHIGGGGELDTLKRLAAELGIGDHIEWAGARPQQDVLAAYRQSDVFILASVISDDGDRDGLPNVLMEAQSQRLCCLATRVSGIPELIEHAVNGLLVPANHPADLAAALITLAGDPVLRKDLADRGLELLRQQFSMDAGIDQLEELLESL